MDLNGQFYYVKNNKPVGPFTLDELLEKGVSNKTYIWTKGMTNWEKIEAIPVILEKLNNNKPPVFIEPKREENNITQKGKGLKKLFWFVFLGILVVVIGVVALNLKKDEPLKVEIPVKETIENDLKKENLKGEVIYIKELRNDFYDESHYEFNSKGFKTKQTDSYIEWGIGSSEYEYFHEDEKLVKSINSFGSKLYSYTTYITDIEGKILKETVVNADDMSIENITEYKYYFTKNNLDSIVTQRNNLKSEIIQFDFTYFNKKGQKIKSVTPHEVRIFEYNEFSDVEKEFLPLDGQKNIGYAEYLYTYKYDKNKNWIERYLNGELDSSRKIFYKGDDLTMVKNELLKKRESFYSNYDNTDSEIQNNPITDQSNYNSTYSDNNSYGNLQSTGRQCSYCKGTGNCSLCSKVYQVRYYDFGYNKGWKTQNETRKGYIMCSECEGSGVLYKLDAGNWVIKDECYVGTCNSGWNPCNECNSRGNGTNIGSCKQCRGTGSQN